MNTDFEKAYYENPELWNPDRFGSLVTERVRLALDSMPLNVTSVLDIGCGNGVFANRLLAANSLHYAVGMDRSFAALKYVQINRSQADIINLPFSDESFDFVVSMEVVEHLPHNLYYKALAEIVRVASKYILITVPYKENRMLKQVTCPECGCVFHPDYHARSFTKQSMEDLFNFWSCVVPIKVQPIVRVKEFILPGLWKTLRKGYLRGRDFPARALCPQCGYSEKPTFGDEGEFEEVCNNRSKNRNSWKSYLRSFWPKKTTFCWWMSIYTKEI